MLFGIEWDTSSELAFAWSILPILLIGLWVTIQATVLGFVVALVLGYLYVSGSALSIHFYIATGLGVGAAMMLTAALMGLVFLSSGTGHDESVTDLMDDDEWKR